MADYRSHEEMEADQKKLEEEVKPFLDAFREKHKTDTPWVREKRIIEGMRMAQAILCLLDYEVSDLDGIRQRQMAQPAAPYQEPLTAENDPMTYASDCIGGAIKKLDNGLGYYAGEGDPDSWEYDLLVGDKVKLSGCELYTDEIGVIDKVLEDQGESGDEMHCFVKLDSSGEVVIVPDMYDLEFVSRPDPPMLPTDKTEE